MSEIREVKPIEVRRTEILTAAITLFQDKGYDKTSISDIAKYLHISQGLCYRYFKSKEEIFQSAIDEYAGFIADRIIRILKDKNTTLKEKIMEFPRIITLEHDYSKYYDAFHSQGADSFHDQLSLCICRKVYPHAQKLLHKERKEGRIIINDPDTAASFMIFGQLGILLDKNLTLEDKNLKIMRFLNDLFNQ